LRAALSRDPGDWLAQYLLGTLLASVGRTDEALEMWEAAADLDDSFSPLLRNIGWAYWRWCQDLERAQVWYRRAIERQPGEYRLYVELERVLKDAQRPVEERFRLLRSAPPDLQDRRPMAIRIASLVRRWLRAATDAENGQARG
ncbi:MAG TPA: hypothetical protein VM283_04990, partial [Armatimonadota bacterium]|nr:hypothetical protein [Armatimonadota bacterium]